MTLQSLGIKYDCGKFTGHSYAPVYEEYFGTLRDEPINLLELGILEGASLRVWLDYFTKAKIYGIDSGQPVAIQDPRLYQFSSPVHEPQVASYFPDDWFDVIIDDASHVHGQQVAAFEYLWPKLKSGGLYFVEDIPSSTTLPYWASKPGFKVWANFKDAGGSFRDDDILVLVRKP
jgi:hypothetical protein